MKSLRTLTALIAVTIVVADQVTKHWALNALGEDRKSVV